MSTPTQTAPARATQLTAAAGFTLAAVAVILANTGLRPGERGGTGPMIFGIALSGCVALALGLLLSRTTRPAGVGLVLGVLAVLTVVAYWSGLPYVLGPAAALLGWRAAPSGKAAIAARVLGVLGTVAAVVMLAHDMM
jgi:hypothetical protein